MELTFQQTEYLGKLLNFAPTKGGLLIVLTHPPKRQNNDV